MIPAFVNPKAGSAEAAQAALDADPRFSPRSVSPHELPGAIERAVASGASRILVAGGDGTVATAVRPLLNTPVELALLPGGTLNHFARSVGLLRPPEEALDIAAGAAARPVDIATVNDRPFLNTSSVGTYVALVRRRERLRQYLRYHLAGLVAALGVLIRLPTFTVEVEIDGNRQRLRTPLVFFGVGERDLRLRSFGDRLPGGPADLHAIVVRGKGRARLLAVGLATARYGIWRVASTPHVDSFMISECAVHLPNPEGRVALDGEVFTMRSPLRYGIIRGGLNIVAPAPFEPRR